MVKLLLIYIYHVYTIFSEMIKNTKIQLPSYLALFSIWRDRLDNLGIYRHLIKHSKNSID